jgi:hypothetical protein
LDASARALGQLIWAKRRCFELLGAWVTSTPEPAAKLALAGISVRQGMGAQSLEALLPETRDHDPDRAIAALEAGWPGLGDHEVTATAGRLQAVGAALEELVATADRVRDSMSAVSDGPARRALWLTAQNDRCDLAECQAVASLK